MAPGFKMRHSDSTPLHLVLVSVIQLARSDCGACGGFDSLQCNDCAIATTIVCRASSM